MIMDSSTYAQILFKIDKDLEGCSLSTAESCLEIFRGKGGIFEYYSEDNPFKLSLQKKDAVYPICSGGVCRSQTLWALLNRFSDEIVLFPPHAARHGWDPYNGTINRNRNQEKEGLTDEFSLFFGRQKSERFGFQHQALWKMFLPNPTQQQLEMISDYYTDHYFGPYSHFEGRKGKRRIYIAFSNNAHVAMYRLNQANADLSQVKLIAIQLDDLISHPPAFLQLTCVQKQPMNILPIF